MRKSLSRQSLKRSVASIDTLEARTLFAVAGPFQSRGPGGGGAFFAPSFNPADSGDLYVSSDMSGLYHATAPNQNWSLVDFREVQANRGSRVAFTNNASIRYVLNYDESNVVRPAKTIDGGATWTDLAAWTNTVGDDAYSLFADPNASNRILVSSYGTLYLSTDSGATFTAKYSASDFFIGGAFFDGAKIYVGTSAGLLVSTNNGSSFALSAATGLPADGKIVSLAGAKSGSTTRLFVTTANAGDVYPGLHVEDDLAGSFKGIYSLDIGAASWTNRSAGIPAGNYPHFVGTARGDINNVYAAGSSDAGRPIVFKTATAGASWTSTLLTVNNQNVATGWQGHNGDRDWGFGELVMDFAVAPSNPNVLAFTDFGYVHMSTDGGATWKQAYVDHADENAVGTNTPKGKPYHGIGLEDTSALWLTWADANNVVAGYTDIRGVRSTDAGASWSFPSTLSTVGNTLYQISSRTVGGNVTLYGAGSNTHDIYQSTHLTDATLNSGVGEIVTSTDKGATWTVLHDFGNPVVFTALDPTNPNRMYASVVDSATGGVFVTNNLNAGTAATWTKVTNPPRTEGHPYTLNVLNDGTLVVTYSARRTSVFTASSGVFVSTNQGSTWADRTLIGPSGFTSAPAMQWWTKDLTVDPTDPTQNTWYVGVRSGYGGDGSANDKGGLYKTTDRGVSWTRIFSNDSVESATLNPNDGGLYVATNASGLWFSANPNAATPTFAQLDYPFRQPARIFVNPNNASEMWVASFGYGLAKVNIASVDTTPPTVQSTTFQYEVAPLSITIAFSEDISASLTVNDFIITNRTANSTLDPSAYTLTQNAAAHTATLAFAGPLADGDYRLTLPSGTIADVAGNASTTSLMYGFFNFAGDVNHDRKVNFDDLIILAQNYNTTGKTFSQGNVDRSVGGAVNFDDLIILAQQYGKVLTAVPVLAPTASKRTRTSRAAVADLI